MLLLKSIKEILYHVQSQHCLPQDTFKCQQIDIATTLKITRVLTYLPIYPKRWQSSIISTKIASKAKKKRTRATSPMQRYVESSLNIFFVLVWIGCSWYKSDQTTTSQAGLNFFCNGPK
jgi:hypothetical protein